MVTCAGAGSERRFVSRRHDSVSQTFARLAKRLGATIVDDSECRRIFVENRRFRAFRSPEPEHDPCLGLHFGREYFGIRRPHVVYGHQMAREKKSPKPMGWRFTLALTVAQRSDCSWPFRRTIWKEPTAPVVEIEVADPSDYGAKQADQKLIFLRTILPFTQESLVASYQRMVAARMFRVATEIIPFLEKHVIKVYPDFRYAETASPERIENADELSEVYSFAIPQVIPENLRVYETTTRTSTGVEGLFVAAGDLFPKLGPWAHRLGDRSDGVDCASLGAFGPDRLKTFPVEKNFDGFTKKCLGLDSADAREASRS